VNEPWQSAIPITASRYVAEFTLSAVEGLLLEVDGLCLLKEKNVRVLE
jgi:hypothetical protein